MGNEGKRNKRIGETEKKRDRERGREREGDADGLAASQGLRTVA